MPAVLGTASEVLDVGRTARLVTSAIRTALIQRDGRCTFPGCDARPTVCEAHHVVPWWAGRVTALSNLASHQSARYRRPVNRLARVPVTR